MKRSLSTALLAAGLASAGQVMADPMLWQDNTTA